MRVAFVTMQFPVPSETFACNDIRLLRKSGLEISVHGLRREHPGSAGLREERGIAEIPTTHNSPMSTLRGLAAVLLRPALAGRTLAWLIGTSWRRPVQLAKSLILLPRAFDILEELQREEPEVVHIYWGHYPSLVGRLVQSSLPHVVTSLSLAAYDLTEEYAPTRDVARRADFLRTLARVNVPDIVRFTGVPEQRVRVIHDGVDVDGIERLVAGVRRIGGRVAVASRLIPSKRVDAALRVFAGARGANPDATMVVMGDGPERQRLEQLSRSLGIGDAVEFLGHVSHERVIREFARSEVLLFPSAKASERLPNAVKEAMSCGCICLASATPGIQELVRPGESGYVFGLESYAEAEEMLSRILSESGEETVTSAARERIRSHFDLRVTTRSYLECWDSALADRSSRSRSRHELAGQGLQPTGGAR